MGEPAITVVAHEVHSEGGMERAMMEVISGLLARGWKVTLLSRVSQLEAHPRLRWVRIATPRKPVALGLPLFAVVAGLRLSRQQRRGGPAITLGAIVPNRVGMVTVQFCNAAAARGGVRRGSRGGVLRNALRELADALASRLERWCYRPGRVERMTAVSEQIKRELQEYYPLSDVPIDVIPNGVDIERFRPDPAARQEARDSLGLDADTLVAVFVGGDWHRKGLETALRASARAGWTLVIAGEGDEQRWRAVARKCGARAAFCGHVRDPERVLSAGDAFVLPSLYEGFALVAIEAAATGLPLLVTRAAGADALLERMGEHPLPHDADAFAEALISLANDPQRRRELGNRARTAAEDLAWPKLVEAYARAYRSVAVRR